MQLNIRKTLIKLIAPDRIFLKKIRKYEAEIFKEYLNSNDKVLEIGGGAGWTASILSSHVDEIISIDIESSSYACNRVFKVINYNGKDIPFPNDYFDKVISSNVLEHIEDQKNINSEISRVLKNNGRVVHMIPSSQWRVGTILTGFFSFRFNLRPHGALCKNAITEVGFFSKRFWKQQFISYKWKVLTISTNNIFYTGHSLFGRYISIPNRRRLSKIIGSSCNIYILEKP